MRTLVFWLLLLPAFVDAAYADLLEPDKAFRVSARLLDAGMLEVRYRIAPGYYMYRDKFRFAAEPAQVAVDASSLPAGAIRKDEFFGEMQTYRGELRMALRVNFGGEPVERFVLKIVSQGCADIGVCYPPHEQRVDLRLAAVSTAGGTGASGSPFLPGAVGLPAPARQSAVPGSDGTRLADLFQGNPWIPLAGLASLGLLLALVYHLVRAPSGAGAWLLRPTGRANVASGDAPAFARVGSLEDLQPALRAAAARPAMLFFYTNRRSACEQVERLTFADARVRTRLAGFALLRVDVSAASPDHTALLQRFGLSGAPAFVFFNAAGEEMPDLRVEGYAPADRFAAILDRALL